MTEPLHISLETLRSVCDTVLAHVANFKGESVALEKDYFWSIPPDDLFDVYQEPTDLTVGQVSESWQHLADLLEKRSDVLNHHLVWLADVLRAIGYQTIERDS